LSGVASAQIVIEDAGGIVNVNIHTSGTYSYSFTTIYRYGATVPIEPLVGHTTYDTYATTTIVYAQAAFEFNLSPVIPPTFTSNNFTAKLDGLNVTNSHAYYPLPRTMYVDLFDMGDAYEDGEVDDDDYNMTRGSRIARRTHDFAGTDADFNNLDVTDALRRDLFDLGGSNEDYSGFILKSPDAQSELVWYDPATPTITITTGGGPPVLSDLAVSKTVDDTTPDEGQTITYTITLTNNGPAQATTIAVTDIVPAGVTYVAASITGGDSNDDANPATTGLTWTVNSLNSGANTTLTFQAAVDAGTGCSTITNSITAVLDQTDSNVTQDDLSEAITVNNVGGCGGGGGGGGGCFIVNAAH
jgi:uncharacterized repeat protein (TIGR01451 family)